VRHDHGEETHADQPNLARFRDCRLLREILHRSDNKKNKKQQKLSVARPPVQPSGAQPPPDLEDVLFTNDTIELKKVGTSFLGFAKKHIKGNF
jgi:hypothetical protein